MKKNCEFCGKEFETSKTNKRFCNRICKGRNSLINLTRRRNKHCLNCKKLLWYSNRTGYCRDCYANIIAVPRIKNFHNKGSDNPNWKGGICREYGRKMKKDIFKCELCKQIVSRFRRHLHHIDLNPKNNTESNIIILCASCHKKVHCYLKVAKKRIVLRQG